ncbi:MAG: Uracil-DNA glycosylase superfamily [Frankiales bacterium]|nr:Uracil-DNA glycosylase superfamily [Frankiales bacterium]
MQATASTMVPSPGEMIASVRRPLQATARSDALDALRRIRTEITNHPDNEWAAKLGYRPLYTADPEARVLVVGQAPGLRAQRSGVPWNDPSGATLRRWLGVDDATFYDSGSFALLPMDFFFPGKGAHGDLPPRRGLADKWHPPILGQLPRVELTILIGSYAQRHYLQQTSGARLTDTVAAWRDFMPTHFPLVHPSPLNFRWQARNPWFEAEVVPALRAAVDVALAGREAAGRAGGF